MESSTPIAQRMNRTCAKPPGQLEEEFGPDGTLGARHQERRCTGSVACLTAVAEAIRAKLQPNPVDISEVMAELNMLLDASITGAAIPTLPGVMLDLSKIDFAELASRFEKSRAKNTDLEVLKAAIRAQLQKMIRLNRIRADFQGTFEELIESYNNGSRTIEDLFQELVAPSKTLTDEQQRHVRESMSEEELVILDIPPCSGTDHRRTSRSEKGRRELLARLKQLLVLNWRQKSSARSQLKIAIEDVLDNGLPRAYTPELYQQKCSSLFEHVYESYPERDAGIYASPS